VHTVHSARPKPCYPASAGAESGRMPRAPTRTAVCNRHREIRGQGEGGVPSTPYNFGEPDEDYQARGRE